MGGIGARRSLLTAGKAPGPPISLRTMATGGGGSLTSHTVTNTATLAGSVQILVVAISKGSTGTPTITPGGSGWISLGGFLGNVATINSGLWVWCRPVSAGETTFNITLSAAATLSWTIEEWLNIDTTALPSAPAIPFTMSATTSTSAQTGLSSNAVTAAVGDLVHSSLGGRGPATGTMGQSFGGGATASNVAASGRAAVAFTAYQLVSSAGSVTHTMTYTNTQGSANTVRGSFLFKQAP